MVRIVAEHRDQYGVEPCLPADWNAFTVHYRYRETVHHITVHNAPPPAGATRLKIDGQDRDGVDVPLTDDRREHWVEIWVHRVS